AEVKRAVKDLGAKGALVYTSIAGEPLDQKKFDPFFAALAELDLPVWLHPVRTAAMPDYPSEQKSRFEMWWCFGWPYDTSVAMARLVFCGLFDRHPGIKIITHHCGGMIPFFDGRVGAGMAVLGARTTDEDYSAVLPALKRPHLDYFRDFYADTAMFGGQYGVPCGLAFFGAERIVFATDAPLGPIAPTIAAVDALEVDAAGRAKIRHGNAARLLNMRFE
ncbi:MAG: amidohydrolase family protein, partial [Proteobacteria bacterium]|nr:amidohydrolase family protein [Pseudomonadota bacterium]